MAADAPRDRRRGAAATTAQEGSGGRGTHAGVAPSPSGGSSGAPSTAKANVGPAWHHRNGASPASVEKGNPSFLAALRGIEEADRPTEWVWRCIGTALEHTSAGRSDVEVVLKKYLSWLTPPVSTTVLAQIASSSVPNAVVRILRKFRNEPPIAALACVVMYRSSGNTEVASAHVRAGAMEEVGALMDRHSAHGGIQNVCLLLLGALLKDSLAARQAVILGTASRVMRAMEISGREVQYNGLAGLRLLTDNGRAPRAGLQEAAMRAKVAHATDNAVCSVSNDVLSLVTPRFKEVLCWHWQSGWCKLGHRCTYAHGPTDLRTS